MRASKTETATPKLSSPENNSISDIVIQQFPITRTISLKKNWIQLQVKNQRKLKRKKKPTWKVKLSCSNDDLDTFICEDINGTFTACGGDVTFWKLKKFQYFTDNHITVIITINRECYDIKRNVGIGYFFFNLELCSNFVCFREIFASFDFDENYNYIHHVI